MPGNQPLWLKGVLRLERAIGKPVEAAVRSDTYFDLISTTTRVRRKAKGAAEGLSRRALHLLNLPAGSDISGVRRQLARVERRLDQLSSEIAETVPGEIAGRVPDEVAERDDRHPSSGVR